eukprot:scaffold20343_cov103-Isochrysis_galbana.AAC.8
MAAANAASCAAKTTQRYPMPLTVEAPEPALSRAACSARNVNDVKTPTKPAWKAIHEMCISLLVAFDCSE